MSNVSPKGMPRRRETLVSHAGMLLSLGISVVGAILSASLAHAAALNVSGPYLFYENAGPNDYVLNDPQSGGQLIQYGAVSVLPDVATTGAATTTNITTGRIITLPAIVLDASPLTPYFFVGTKSLCTTNCTPSGNNNPSNLTAPWTITFQNPSTSPYSTQLSLVGAEIPFVNNVTLSGSVTEPTFRWSPPSGLTPDGYRVSIYQNGVGTPEDNQAGEVLNTSLPPTVTSYTVTPADFTVPGHPLLNNTTYTIEIELTQTRDGTTNTQQNNLSAVSRIYSTFQIPSESGEIIPLINLPTTTVISNRVIYGFNMTVVPGTSYDIDPAVATGYVYQTGSGNPNFASVELPDIGNPSPYELYLWNGSSFVFDTALAADTVFDFAAGGVGEFEVLGIDPYLDLDPRDPTAFITALTFEGAGDFTGTMMPLTTDIPEPASLTLLVSSLLGLGLIRRRGML